MPEESKRIYYLTGATGAASAVNSGVRLAHATGILVPCKQDIQSQIPATLRQEQIPDLLQLALGMGVAVISYLHLRKKRK